MDSHYSKHLLRWLAASLLAGTALLFVYLSFRPDGLDHIYVLDVGQGDSILIRTADNHTALIDGGPDDTVLTRLGEILPPWQNSLDLVVLTHPDSDHSAGLNAVLNRYHVGTVWFNGVDHDTQTYHTFEQLLKDKNIPTDIVRAGAKATWSQATLTALYPFSDTTLTGLDSNDTGIVTEFSDKNFDMLLTADISDKVEAQLLARNVITPVEVIKVPHHGSKTSSSAPLIAAAHPDIALISVGANNRYGHPTPEALARYKTANVPVLRTDQVGTIQLVTDGLSYKIKTSR